MTERIPFFATEIGTPRKTVTITRLPTGAITISVEESVSMCAHGDWCGAPCTPASIEQTLTPAEAEALTNYLLADYRTYPRYKSGRR